MNKYTVSLILIMFAVSMSIPLVQGKPDNEERGLYIYDERGAISQESYLGLSAYLWKLDVKTGYEIVVVYPKEKMDETQMQQWFNSHGVGKKAPKDNGIAVFIFPDNTAFGMIGKGQDRIAVPYVSTMGARSLKNLKDDPVLATLRFLNVMGKKLDEPTSTTMTANTTKTVVENLDLILAFFFFIYLLLVLLQQNDGFQLSDLILPAIFGILMLFVILIMMAGSSMSENQHNEYGLITDTKLGSHIITETHSRPCGKSTCFYTDTHTIYTNDIQITSYDFRKYPDRLQGKDNRWAWDIKVGHKVRISINKENNLMSTDLNIDDNSGGQSDRYGTWIKTT